MAGDPPSQESDTSPIILRERINLWLRAGLDLLFPIQCAGCGVAGVVWCTECNEAIARLREPVCQYCGFPLASLRSCPSCRQRRPTLPVRSYARYTGQLVQALLRLKYRPDRQLAAVMAAWLVTVYDREGWVAELVVPVPLSKQRAQHRGFNQAELLAVALGRYLALPVETHQLRRAQDTPSQVGLDPHQRWENVERAFEARPQSFDGARVLLVDDLFTTGATLSACANAVSSAGAKSVMGLSVARA